jgi:glycosyltransferase involved in cell wall biosynthesis
VSLSVYALLPSLSDAHFKKDAGMIPYIMQKYYGYRAVYVTYRVGREEPEYPSLSLYSEKVSFDYLPAAFADSYRDINRIYSDQADTCRKDLTAYLATHAAEIDVLFLFGFYPYYFQAVRLYKKQNPRGFVYLKLDANLWWVNQMGVHAEFASFLRCCDLVTSESLVEYLNLKWPVPVHYLPNGSYNFDCGAAETVSFSDKEDLILTAGRLGSPPKATEILLEAFRLAADSIPSWSLVLAGAVEEPFRPVIGAFLKRYPNLSGRILFTGYLQDPNELRRYFRRAKIFAFPSRSEAFAHVISEAKASGCYLVASDLPSNRDAVTQPLQRNRMLSDAYRACHRRERFGSLFDVDQVRELSERLEEACRDQETLRRVCLETQEDASEHFDWVRLCGRIDCFIKNSAGWKAD